MVLASNAIASTTVDGTTLTSEVTTSDYQEITTLFVEETTLGYEDTSTEYGPTTTGADETTTGYSETTNIDETTSDYQNTTNTDNTTPIHVETTNVEESTSGYEETTIGVEDNSTNTTPTWEVTDQTTKTPSSTSSDTNSSISPIIPSYLSDIFTPSLKIGSNPFSGLVSSPVSFPSPSSNGTCDPCNCNNQMDVGSPQPCMCPRGQTKRKASGSNVCCKASPTTNWSWPRLCGGVTLLAQNYKNFPCGAMVEKNCGQCTSGGFQTITVGGTTACCCNEVPKP